MNVARAKVVRAFVGRTGALGPAGTSAINAVLSRREHTSSAEVAADAPVQYAPQPPNAHRATVAAVASAVASESVWQEPRAVAGNHSLRIGFWNTNKARFTKCADTLSILLSGKQPAVAASTFEKRDTSGVSKEFRDCDILLFTEVTPRGLANFMSAAPAAGFSLKSSVAAKPRFHGEVHVCLHKESIDVACEELYYEKHEELFDYPPLHIRVTDFRFRLPVVFELVVAHLPPSSRAGALREQKKSLFDILDAKSRDNGSAVLVAADFNTHVGRPASWGNGIQGNVGTSQAGRKYDDFMWNNALASQAQLSGWAYNMESYAGSDRLSDHSPVFCVLRELRKRK